MIWNKATQGEAKIVNIPLIRCTVCPDKQLVKSLIWERCSNLYLLTGCKGYIAFWLLKCSIEKLKVDLDMLCVFGGVCQMPVAMCHTDTWMWLLFLKENPSSKATTAWENLIIFVYIWIYFLICMKNYDPHSQEQSSFYVLFNISPMGEKKATKPSSVCKAITSLHPLF